MRQMRSLVVCPKYHLDDRRCEEENQANYADDGPVVDKTSIHFKRHAKSKKTPTAFMEELQKAAVIVDPRPNLSADETATLVLWNSQLPHCNGEYGPMMSERWKQGGCRQPPFATELESSEHFPVASVEKWKSQFFANGYVVLELGLSKAGRDEILDDLLEAIQRMQRDPKDKPKTLREVTEAILPLFPGKGLRVFHGLPNTPFADKMRLLAKPAFKHLFETANLTCSLDSVAISAPPKWGGSLKKGCTVKNDNWLHIDQDPSSSELIVQGTVYLHGGRIKEWKRVAVHTCWLPTSRRFKSTCGRITAVVTNKTGPIPRKVKSVEIKLSNGEMKRVSRDHLRRLKALETDDAEEKDFVKPKKMTDGLEEVGPYVVGENCIRPEVGMRVRMISTYELMEQIRTRREASSHLATFPKPLWDAPVTAYARFRRMRTNLCTYRPQSEREKAEELKRFRALVPPED